MSLSQTAIDTLAHVFPEFVPSDPLARSLKCQLITGRFEGRPVVAKVLFHTDPIWRWYFEREAVILEMLPEGIAPLLRASNLPAGVMIIDRITGEGMTTQRRATRPISTRALQYLLATIDRLHNFSTPLPADPPASPVVKTMRQRLLEDPSAPRGWFLAGIDRCRDLSILSYAEHDLLQEILAESPIAPGHGDLLPRNVIIDGDEATLVDWECAGFHLRDWDRALLWANAPLHREAIEADLSAPFLALAAYALCREVKFARRSARQDALQTDLTRTLARLRTEI